MSAGGASDGTVAAEQPAAAAAAANRDRLPLWLTVKNGVLATIRDEGLGPDARLPSESALCRRFGVSRIVVREAMAQLVAARVAYRIQGKGAFVARREEPQEFIGAMRGFSGELLDSRHAVTRRILRQEVVVPEEEVRDRLGLAPDEEVVRLERVMAVDGVPRIHVESLIPRALAPGLERLPMENRPLYATLQRQYGLFFARAQRWLDARAATAEVARLLGVRNGAPLLGIESLSFATGDRPAEYYRAQYRTDQARLALTVG
ncbi:MAG: GntR family transcriptional regulator [Gluconacetobacter diazotrophicus]|nr:GntR family transcriptional regulator [Gluconacetobacter diazotrophicus]